MSPLETVPSGAQTNARSYNQISLLRSELPHQESAKENLPNSENYVIKEDEF